MAGGAASAPVTAAEFAWLMASVGGFEPAPRLAVAVSGGADSLALALLAADWARARQGSAIALIVDHRLRPESAAEAARVAAWLEGRGIEHRVLVWSGPHPGQDVQAAARRARYALLAGWCRDAGVLHLLTAHHRDDQAETLLLRLARGSGLFGLAGMAPLVEEGACRLVRPLLAVPPARLRATLKAAGQAWIEDPSNRNPAFARARLRLEAQALAALGLAPAGLAETAGHLARARIALEREVERLLAQAALVHPAGFVRLDPGPLGRAAEEARLRALAAVVATVGGLDYPPRFERLARLATALDTDRLGGGRTLGGCRVRPWRGRLLVEREPAALGLPVALTAAGQARWDGRFIVEWLGEGTPPAGLRIAALGAEGASALGAIVPAGAAPHLPHSVRRCLPALWLGDTVAAVPHLRWRRPGSTVAARARFRPPRPLCGSGFTAVLAQAHGILTRQVP